VSPHTKTHIVVKLTLIAPLGLKIWLYMNVNYLFYITISIENKYKDRSYKYYAAFINCIIKTKKIVFFIYIIIGIFWSNNMYVIQFLNLIN